MADLHHLGRAAGRRRVAELLDRFELADAARKPVSTYSGRDAPPAGPGDDPGRHAAVDLPRRAHHRAGPAQPPHHVAQHPRAGRRRRDDLPHHPVPRRGRPARRPHRGARPRPDRRRGHPRRAQAPHPGRSHPAAVRRPAGVGVGRRPARPGAARRGEPHPAGARATAAVASLRRLLDRLDDAHIEVEQLSIHTPDLDDVFFAVTGQPRTRADANAEKEAALR